MGSWLGASDTFTLEAYRRSLTELRCEGCNVRFQPKRKGQRFCGVRCRKAVEQRRYRLRPEVQETNRRKRRAAYWANREYELARQAEYDRRRKASA